MKLEEWDVRLASVDWIFVVNRITMRRQEILERERERDRNYNCGLGTSTNLLITREYIRQLISERWVGSLAMNRPILVLIQIAMQEF